MQIYKFGGTSVGSAEGLKNVLQIIGNDEEKIVLVSANGKSTDRLESICLAMKNTQKELLLNEKEKLYDYYLGLSSAVFQSSIQLEEAQKNILTFFRRLDVLSLAVFAEVIHREILAMGELISSKILQLLLRENNIHATLMHAPDIIQQNEAGEVCAEDIRKNLLTWKEEHPESRFIISQGFICSDYKGQISNLGRGGSDFSASLLGQAAKADQIQIWSDVDGFLNNDPGFVETPTPLRQLSFGEAAELAYFGARVLHPLSLMPAQEAGIPVLLKNTFRPNAAGTIISDNTQTGDIKAIAARDNIISITVKSSKMLMAYGYLRRIFEVFEQHQTSIDLVSTSEISVSVSIDQSCRLKAILHDLKAYGSVCFRNNLSIICVVGDHLKENQGKVSAIFNALSTIEVRMISYGSSHNSITFLVDQNDKTKTLRALHEITSQYTERSCISSN